MDVMSKRAVIVKPGLLMAQRDAADPQTKMSSAPAHPEYRATMRRAALERCMRLFMPDDNCHRLLENDRQAADSDARRTAR